MATRPIQLNITTALDKIGKTNGTALPNITAPTGSTNEEAELFHNERAAIFEYMTAAQIKSYAEKRDEKAKANVRRLFDDTVTNTPPSTSSTVVRSDMSLQVEKRKGRETLDEAMLVSAMAKRGYDMPEIEAIIKDAKKTGQPALYLRASIVAGG